MEEFNKKVLLGEATWWQMEIPSGKVLFGESKAKMLDYPDANFKHFSDFTNLVKEEDREKAMQSMRDCLSGKAKLSLTKQFIILKSPTELMLNFMIMVKL